MATKPGFNPNLPSDEFDRMRNRAVADAIEPGSVMKPFTMAIALEAGLARANEVLVTKSPYFIAGVPFHDDHPHPRVTVMEMVKYSSNIGSAQLATRVGADGMVSGFESFGFGVPTGVQTSGEAAGRRHPYAGVGPTELATISFGQGLTATAMQLAMATATIANDGVRLRPILVDRVEDSYGKLRQEYPPVMVQRVVSAETARLVRRAMEMVTEPGGTAERVRVPGYRVGGKTGTAEKVKNGAYSKVARYATFIGFAPAEQPDIAIAVIVDEPTVGSRYGGTVAGPVFVDVAAVALRHRGVPSDPSLEEKEDGEDVIVLTRPEVEPIRLTWVSGGWQMPDLSGRSLRDAVAGLQGAGLDLAVSGSGVLVEQHPSPGMTLTPGDSVSLRFQ
jgi:cell division protein FtsI (penicillin-binding protein 3)